jgi:hypothetical protein
MELSRHWAAGLAMAAAALGPACAADGCTVLLCLAGPWKQVSQCVPPVSETLHDLAHGKPFPACDMSGDGNHAANAWTTQESCPEMYGLYDDQSGAWWRCSYPGLISVYIDGQLWSDMFWDFGGRTSTRYTDYARTQLGEQYLDPTYDNDLAAWKATHPEPPPCPQCGRGS